MKTIDLFKKFSDFLKYKNDLENQKQSLEKEEYTLKKLYIESFPKYLPEFSKLVMAGEWDKVNDILRFLDSNLFTNETSETVLQHKTPKLSHYPDGINPDAGVEFIKDEKFFKEIMEFAASILSKDVVKQIFQDINYSGGIVTGSKPKFIILVNMYLKFINEKRRCLTASQLWKTNDIFNKKFWVDSGLYLNGTQVNSDEAQSFIRQFRKIDKDLALVDSKNGKLVTPIKIDLRGLSLNIEGMFHLTDESIWTETPAFENGNFLFQEVDKFGVNLKSDSGRPHYVPDSHGLFRCFFGWDLDSDGWVEDLGYSYPVGRVVLEIA